MSDWEGKMKLQELRDQLIEHHTDRLNGLAELDLEKEYAAAIVILQDLLTGFNGLYVASHFQVANEYFLAIEKNIEQSVDGVFSVFPELEQLQMFLTAASAVGSRRREKEIQPLLNKMVEEMRTSGWGSGMRRNRGS